MKILAYTSPGRGHLFPVVPILHELRCRGHDTRCRTLEDHVHDLRALGITADAITPEVAAIAHDDWKAASAPEAHKRAMRAFARRAPLDAADLGDAIETERPDMLLVDIMSFGALAVAERSGLSWASWLPYPAWLRSPGIPPYGPGLAPLAGPEGEARDAAVAELLAETAQEVTAAVNEGRRSVGLPMLAEPDDVLLRPPLLLYLTAEPFEYPRPSWPASFRLVGPCPWEPPAPVPLWLADESRPIVLVSTSSEFQDDFRLVTTAFAALRDRNDLLVVATVPAGDTRDYDPPPNGRVEPFVAHRELLARAAAVICHGGMGVTQKALAAGVPVCAVPFGRDQLEVARRLEVSGAGTQLPAADLTVDALSVAIERTVALGSEAERIAAAFASAGGPTAAASAIEELAPSIRRTSWPPPAHR
jgi:MGT family glycosyltransferase